MNESYSKSHYCQFGCFKFQNIYVGFLLHLLFALAMIPPCSPLPPTPKPLLSSLNVTSDFCRSSLHWVYIFSILSCGRLRVIFYGSTNTPERLIKTASSEAEILTYLKQLVLALKLSSRYWNFH